MANSAWRRIMQTPVEIDFQGMSGTPEVHASIEKRVAELEQRYGRVTACRVVLKGPGGHHRTGGLYEVNIRLALPNGREVNVGRTAQADERQADLSFAINDAFQHARRRLQDHVRRVQGQVKQHESQPMGTVKSLDTSGEFGFLEAVDTRVLSEDNRRGCDVPELVGPAQRYGQPLAGAQGCPPRSGADGLLHILARS